MFINTKFKHIMIYLISKSNIYCVLLYEVSFMKKYKNYLLVAGLFFIPISVYASTGNDDFSILLALGMEAFVTLHWVFFVLKPLSKSISKEDSQTVFWKLFWTRIIILLIFDFFITAEIAIYDFLGLFIGAFIVVPVFSNIANKKSSTSNTFNPKEVLSSEATPESCPKCGAELTNPQAKYCSKCGELIEIEQKVLVSQKDFDPIFSKNENKLLEEFIKKELIKVDMKNNGKYIPEEVLKRKNILTIIFSVLVFVYISLVFFHFPLKTYVIGLIILIILFKLTRKYNLVNYLKKEIKARPSEKISNIIMITKEKAVFDNFKILRVLCILIAFIIPFLIFKDPRIMYEKLENGYAVRFYTFGLTNYETATIPKSYKNKPVISLRGNTFSNMPFLKEVNLPDTIKEIRGQAFKNDESIKHIKLPKNLEYLGGGAFYNCISLEDISLPDTLTYMGGESFYNATSLTTVKLSNNLSEIRGNTFEECSSLKTITIPDKVERIGGHAFYGNDSLEEVNLTENSMLKEIGSSAFRNCQNLHTITIPADVSVNERTFKESPTVVQRFGQTNYGASIDEAKYNHKVFEYLFKSNDIKIAENWSDSNVYNTTLRLENINKVNGYNEFVLKYLGTNQEETFTLTKDNPYKEINADLAVEISNDYAFTSSGGLSLYVYFN